MSTQFERHKLLCNFEYAVDAIRRRESDVCFTSELNDVPDQSFVGPLTNTLLKPSAQLRQG